MTSLSPIEEMVLVERYPNYSVTRDGRVFSHASSRWLKKSLNNKGYYEVSLSHSGTSKGFRVHRLVATAFIPNPEGKPCVNHKDSVRTNNDVDNLEWVTHKENSQHGFKHGFVTGAPQNLISTINATKTHCVNGHPLAGDNLLNTTRKRRICRACNSFYVREHYRRHKLSTPHKKDKVGS